GPGTFLGGDPKTPAPELLSPAAPPRRRLPGPAPVLLQPPPLRPQRMSRARRPKPGRTADRPNPSALAGAARLPAIFPKLTAGTAAPRSPPPRRARSGSAPRDV